MDLRSRTFAAALAALSLATLPAAPPAARADDKSLAKWYENKLVGFRFRPLSDWAIVPAGTDPDDPKICGFYSDAAKYDRTVKPECDVYAFRLPKSDLVSTEPGLGGGADGGKEEKPPAASEEEARKQMMDEMRFKSTKEVVEQALERYRSNAEQMLSQQDEKKQKKLRPLVARKDGTTREFKTDAGLLTVLEVPFCMVLTNGRDLFFTDARICAGYLRNDEFEVGVVYQIPDDGWKKYGQPVYASLKSLQFLDGTDVAEARSDLAEALAGKTGDERWLEEIKRKVTTGWDYVQTRNYLLVFDKSVKKERVKQLAVQIEAIRKDVYEVLFPPDAPVTAISVVRVCKDKAQYTQYGGSSGSAGYWYSAAKELVFYDDGGKDAFRVMYHEAFHQYIYYSVGSISPHDWFNEGHGDYFSGHNLSPSGKFVPKPFDWRRDIKGIMGSKTYVKLRMFMYYSHAQYYGPQMGQNYSQGWSVVWFLRGTRNPAWKDILPNYFNTLKGEVTKWANEQIEAKKKDGSYTEGWRPGDTPGDIEEAARTKAINAAFGHFDDRMWEKFEKEWLDFKY